MEALERQGDGGQVGAPPTPAVRASQLLRVRTIWLTPLVVASILVSLIALFYIGSVVNPAGHLSGLPVALADEDRGATVLGQRVDLGAEVASGLLHSQAVSSRLALHAVPLSEAKAQMDSNGVYTTIVIPADFTSSLLSAYGLAPSSGPSRAVPTVRLLTNPRSGSIGVELATGVAEPALGAASRSLGREVSAETTKFGRTPTAATSAANPLTVAVSEYDPLPPNSALGLSAFYISLLSIMCGFLAPSWSTPPSTRRLGIRRPRSGRSGASACRSPSAGGRRSCRNGSLPW